MKLDNKIVIFRRKKTINYNQLKNIKVKIINRFSERILHVHKIINCNNNNLNA